MDKIINGEPIQLTEEEEAAHLEAISLIPPPSYTDLRRAEYPSADELIVALWEKVVEGRPEAAADLQTKREAIKAKYPKPS